MNFLYANKSNNDNYDLRHVAQKSGQTGDILRNRYRFRTNELEDTKQWWYISNV